MSEKKQTDKQWKTEELRAERKARLARMKSPDGGKKPLRQANPVKRAVTIAVILLLVILVAVWGAVRMGVPHRNLNAMTVGSEKINVVELNYYYRTLLNQYGIDPASADGQSALKSASGVEGFKTLEDYVIDQAAQEAQNSVILEAYALDNDVALDEEDLSIISNYKTNLESTARQAGQTVDNYLVAAFGTGMNWNELESIIERSLLAGKGSEALMDSLDFSEEEIQSEYESNPADYDVVDYRMFYFPAGYSSGATDAEKTKAMEIASQKADEMLEEITDEDSFRELSIQYASEEDREAYEENDRSLYRNRAKADTNPLVVADWLFDEERQTGDKESIESASGYYVVYMVNRERPEFRFVDVRHILIGADRNNADEEEINQARTKAENLLDEYLAGEQTEENFALLAGENSEDTGSAGNGGLYQNVYPGQMVREFEEWSFAAGRNPGDTGIVQTDFGFHVMYFVDHGDVVWQAKVKQTLTGRAFSEYMENAAEEWPYDINSFAVKFID